MKRALNILLLTFATLAAGGGPAAAQSGLAGLDGSWTGRGTVRATPTASVAKAYCKVALSETAPGRGWSIDGRCADTRRSATLGVTIRKTGSRLSAHLSTSAIGERVAFAGEANASAMTFASTAPVTIDGRRYRSNLSIRRVGAERFSLVVGMTDGSGGNTRVADLVFKRAR